MDGLYLISLPFSKSPSPKSPGMCMLSSIFKYDHYLINTCASNFPHTILTIYFYVPRLILYGLQDLAYY